MSELTVVFDLDDTLIVDERFAEASFREALALLPGADHERAAPVVFSRIREVWHSSQFHSLCHDLGITSWEGLWATFEGNHRVLDGVRAWAPSYRDQAWRAVVDALSPEASDLADVDLALAASECFQRAQRRGPPVVEGARRVLDDLGARHRLGLLTNGPSDLQRHKLARTGLANYFDAIVISGEVGVGKPSKDVFAHTLGQLGARPQDSVMIGDSWQRDILGATNAGLAAIWIAAGRSVPAHDLAVRVVDDISELRDVVG